MRSSNVYEEQALGVYKPEDDPEVLFETAGGSRMRIWGRYFAMHARRQLAFGLLKYHCLRFNILTKLRFVVACYSSLSYLHH